MIIQIPNITLNSICEKPHAFISKQNRIPIKILKLNTNKLKNELNLRHNIQFTTILRFSLVQLHPKEHLLKHTLEYILTFHNLV